MALSTISGDPTQLSLGECIEVLQRGDLASVDLCRELLDRIESIDPQIRAYLQVPADDLLHQAEQADRRRAEGDSRPLLGVPVAIKDVLSTADIETTAGSKILAGYNPPYTATAVQRLLDAGALILGKTNTDEFAMGSSTENSAFFPTRNPWNLNRVPGGSSGGSAAAVAAEMAPAALGTDTGGSVRQPASFCGVVGLKPSYGRVSRYGLIAYGSSLDQIGPLTRNVADAALLLETMAGPDSKDSTTVDRPISDLRAALNERVDGLRIGIPQSYFGEGLDPEVEAAVIQASRVLKDLGAELVDIEMTNAARALPVYYLVATAEASANLARFDGIRYGPRAASDDLLDTYRKTRGQGFGSEVKRRIMLGTYALSAGYYDAYYLKAQQVRTLIRQDFEAAFETVDLMLAPVSPTTAFKIGEKSQDPLAMLLADIYTVSINLAGNCAISVPCGFDSDGLPIGLQIIGPSFGEKTLLHAAHAYEQATEWSSHRPTLTPVAPDPNASAEDESYET